MRNMPLLVNIQEKMYNISVYNLLISLDQEELDTEIKNVRDGLKVKVSKLHQMEGW